MEHSREEARKILSIVHGVASFTQGVEGTLETCQKHPCIQEDPIDVAGTNADLTLQSRVADYDQKYLYTLLYETRDLFEYFCKMMSILPIKTFPIFKHKMENYEKKFASFFKENKKKVKSILNAAEEGPISSRELADMGKSLWGWGRSARISNIILTRLWVAGKVMVHHRVGRTRYYTITENIIPEEFLSTEARFEEEDLQEIVHLIVRSSRLVSPSKAPEQWYQVGGVKKVRNILEKLEKEGDIFSLRVQGWRGKLYAPIDDKKIWEDPLPCPEHLRFLAPLDPLTWNRALFETVYGRKYVWEVYKKQEDRKYGYYCLPIILNGDYIGLIEPYLRKEDKSLEIRSFHLFDRCIDKTAFLHALKDELNRFSENVGAIGLDIKSSHPWLEGITTPTTS